MTTIEDEKNLFESAVALVAHLEVVMDAHEAGQPAVTSTISRDALADIHVDALSLVSEQAVRIYKLGNGMLKEE